MAPSTDERPAREVDQPLGQTWTAGRVAMVAAFGLMAAFWIVIWSGVLAKENPDRLDDRAYVERLEARCQQLRDDLDALPRPTDTPEADERAEVLDSPDGDEILPVEYSDNYLTVYPGESVQLQADVPAGSAPGWVRVTGYNTDAGVVPIADANR